MINLPKLPFFSKQKTVKVQTVEELSNFEKIKELIAPAGAQFATDYFQLGNLFGRTVFILDYPSFLISGWLEKIINLPDVFNIAIYFVPVETSEALKQLEKQLARIQVQINERANKVRSPELEAAYKNVESLRDLLVQAQEKIFKVGCYLTLYEHDKQTLDLKTNQLLKNLEGSLITAKSVMFQQKDAFIATNALAFDPIQILYHMNSSSASSFFPFISSSIVSNNGIFLGVNLQNASLVILDRWEYENPHMVILARSGSGKSYTSKLEVMRHLMLGEDVFILDPENEYKSIVDLYNGSFVSLSLRSEATINPFEIPPVLPGEDPLDIYKEHIADLINFCQLLLGEQLSPEELAILDQAIQQTYISYNILPTSDFSKIEVFPTLNDLEKILASLVGGESIARKFYAYTTGNFSGFLNKQTTIELDRRLIVFGIKDLPEILKPIGMFMALSYILNRVRRDIKKRLIIIDEAWWIMRQPFGAEFLLNVVKRGRKYGVAVNTITQDIEDFLNSPFGKPIITNSAISLLMKQSAATIDICDKAFVLSEGEKQFLLQAERGEGLMITSKGRVPLYILASYAEDQIIRTRPEQLIALRKAKERVNINQK